MITVWGTILFAIIFILLLIRVSIFENEKKHIEPQVCCGILKELRKKRKDIGKTRIIGLILYITSAILLLLFLINAFALSIDFVDKINDSIFSLIVFLLLTVSGYVVLRLSVVRTTRELSDYNNGKNVNFDTYVSMKKNEYNYAQTTNDNYVYESAEKHKERHDAFLQSSASTYRIIGIIFLVSFAIMAFIVLFVPIKLIAYDCSLFDFIDLIVKSEDSFIDALKNPEMVCYMFVALFFILSYLGVLFRGINYLKLAKNPSRIGGLCISNSLEVSKIISPIFLLSSINSYEKRMLNIVQLQSFKICAYMFLALFVISYIVKIVVMSNRNSLYENRKYSFVNRMHFLMATIFDITLIVFVIVFFEVNGTKAVNIFPQEYISYLVAQISAISNYEFVYLFTNIFTIIMFTMGIKSFLSEIIDIFMCDEMIIEMYGNRTKKYNLVFSLVSFFKYIMVLLGIFVAMLIPLILDTVIGVSKPNFVFSKLFEKFNAVYLSQTNIIFFIVLICLYLLIRLLSILRMKFLRDKRVR